MRILGIFFFWIVYNGMYGQQDTSYLSYDRLHWSDIERDKSGEVITKVEAGTRTERNLKDLPFTAFVITAEEIREQGYYTLVDALKHIPGIRVSQPVSGLDGEGFMMRGLYGNSYTKILINDIPIKPSIVGAMPIGSQLPIRQADRIEVIYGPAATLYGADAASGVINIKLKESEYPTFAQADLEAGNSDLTRLNAMFGGKFALGKKTLKLHMYGGFTSFGDRRIKYDEEHNYNPAIYERFLNNRELVAYELRPNYVGTTTSTALSQLPHESSYLGFTAAVGSIEFNTQRMVRTDHSSIGLSPYAVSYADPQSLIGEEILTTSLVLKRNYNQWDFKVQLGTLLYTMNPLASYNYVLPTFGIVTNLFVNENPTFVGSKIDGTQYIDSLYLSGPRYVSSNTSDFYINAQFNFKISDEFGISTGLQSLSGFGDAIDQFRSLPESTGDQFIQTPTLPHLRALFAEAVTFVEGYLDYGPFHAIAGAQIFLRADSLVSNKTQFNPRIGLLYQLSPKFSVRASYCSAFRYPSPFLGGSTFQITTKGDFIGVATGSPDIEPERTISFEGGIRYEPHQAFRLDGSIYYTRTSNYINYDFVRGDDLSTYFLGYQNEAGSFNRLFGAQLHVRIEEIWPAINLQTHINLNYSQGKERIKELFIGNIRTTDLLDITAVRAQPDLIGHIRFSFDLGKELSIHINNNFVTSSWTRNIYRISQAMENNVPEQIINPGFYTMDLRSVFRISRQLNAYAQVSNLTNTKYAGIDASLDPDVLLYNPQPLISVRAGFNFVFN